MPTLLQRAYKSLFDVCHRYDLSKWAHSPEHDVAIYGMYHIWCAPGWEEMVSRQMAHLRRSGLLGATEKLYVSCIINGKDDLDKLKGILGSEPVEIISVTGNTGAFEFPALDYMYRKSQSGDFLFYYFHTKGISYQSLNTDDRRFIAFRRKIEAWREMMEYFLMDMWRVAVNVLQDGYDTYGCYLFPPFKNKMYAGNFWWARSEYFRSLPEISEEMKATNRFLAEEWLLSTGRACAFSAFDTVADLYDVRIDAAQYELGRHSWVQSLRFFLIYTFRKYQRKWFHYSYKHRCQRRFQMLSGRAVSR